MVAVYRQRESLRLITSLTNRWAELYRVKRIEDNKNVLSRLQELDRNYQEREEFRMQLLVKTLEEYKKSFIKKSECAFAWRYVKRLPHREKRSVMLLWSQVAIHQAA